MQARTVGGRVADSISTGAVHRVLADEVRRLHAARPGSHPRVLDVGGGSGGWAVPMARLGCAVTVVDNSPNALAALHRRARDAGVADLVTPVQGDVDALSEAAPADGADLVLGHELLEVVDDATSAVAALRQAAAPGAAVSVLVAGRYAAVLGRALGGRLAEARALLTDPDGRYGPHDALRRRLDTAALRRLLGTGGLRIELLQGDGVIDGWVPGSVRDGGPAVAAELAPAGRAGRRRGTVARRGGPAARAGPPPRPTRWPERPRRRVIPPDTPGPVARTTIRSRWARRYPAARTNVASGAEGTNGLLPFGWDRPRIRVSSDAAVPAASQLTPLATRCGRDRPGRLTSPASRRAERLVSSAVEAHPRALVASFRHHGR